MRIIAAVLLSSVLASAVHAQSTTETTNAPPTKIETLESATNAIIVRGIGDAGSASVGSGTLTFRLKSSSNVDTGAQLQGLTLEYTVANFHQRAVIDYDELAGLLKAIDYIQTVNHDVTQLPNFVVSFRTKSGFQVIGVGSRRQSFVQLFLQFGNGGRIVANPSQMSQVRGMIANCKVALEALASSK
jgi:hypothetical protein